MSDANHDRHEALRVLEAKVQQSLRKRWQSIAGSQLEHMLENESSAIEYLEHPDPSIRGVAIEVCVSFWRAANDEGFRRRVERLSIEEEDSMIRTVAVVHFAACYAGTDDVRVGEVLAKMVYDTHAPSSVRCAAYGGLFVLRGTFKRPVRGSQSEEFEDILARIDRSFVDSFLVTKRAPSPTTPIDWDFEKGSE